MTQSTAMSGSAQKIRHEWYQNDSQVVISVFAKKCKDDQVKVEFQPKALTVTIKLPESEYVLDLEPLAHEVVPEESSYTIMQTKVEIKLKKQQIGISWGQLEGEDVPTVMASVSNDKPPAYPSSSKKHVDWSSVEKSVEEEKPEGEQALNALFQKIYKDGNDEVRRAMVKSFTESGGTTLSTNWNEIGKESTPIRPPDGVEARKWET
ncbi:hypothetical protein MIR68_005364 [Amoeboaphelidium protococcarum]|nr:hypothetical protein MIR68_005364 [Amoeboaphelidium protococcarum]KAI3645735.1 hypothetical protein MP228_008663 [Amoeboaphelidium protococcarum]